MDSQVNNKSSFDLEPRTFEFAKSVVSFSHKLARGNINFSLIDQLTRSASSVGANYIEANESISKKDFYYRLRICRKEAKESNYWLKLIISANSQWEKDAKPLLQESMELVKIFSAIINRNT